MKKSIAIIICTLSIVCIRCDVAQQILETAIVTSSQNQSDCTKVKHQWLREETSTSGAYNSSNFKIMCEGSLWIKIDENVTQGLEMQFQNCDFVSFANKFPYNFNKVTKTLKVTYADIQSTNGKYLLLGDLVWNYIPSKHGPDQQAVKTKVVYLPNKLGDFSQCDFQFRESGGKQKNFRVILKDEYIVNKSDL